MPTVRGRTLKYPNERKGKTPPNWEGRVFGRLTVIKWLGVSRCNHRTWLCKCECGKEISAETGNLTSGNTKSCGCLARELSRESAKLLPRLVLPLGASQKKTVIQRYKAHGHMWSLSSDEAETLLLGNCHYCGVSPSNRAATRKSNGAFIYNGIDRIDNSRGYESGNVVSCCKRCNVAKNNMTYKEFKEWVNNVYSRFRDNTEVEYAAS